MAKREPKICPTHDRPLVYSKSQKIWYCPDCLHSSYLSWQAQQEAVKRYRQTGKGQEAQERYEQSEKGKAAREKYLKSEKYKQRRREYNQRLKESLQIARAAKLDRPSAQKEVEIMVSTEMSPLLLDIMEYQDTMGRNPPVAEVREWSTDVYKTNLSVEKAKELIETATRRRHE